jgi:hypothetical protein
MEASSIRHWSSSRISAFPEMLPGNAATLAAILVEQRMRKP